MKDKTTVIDIIGKRKRTSTNRDEVFALNSLLNELIGSGVVRIDKIDGKQYYKHEKIFYDAEWVKLKPHHTLHVNSRIIEEERWISVSGYQTHRFDNETVIITYKRKTHEKPIEIRLCIDSDFLCNLYNEFGDRLIFKSNMLMVKLNQMIEVVQMQRKINSYLS